MNLQVDVERVLLAHKVVRAELLAERAHDGHWIGQVASSPLATAAAISALVTAHSSGAGDTLQDRLAVESHVIQELVQGDLSELLLESVSWLARHQNDDGGWGDCDRAHSNLAATLLVHAAFRITGVPAKYVDLIARADDYIAAQGGAVALRRNDAADKTLVAAVLTNCALAGVVPWRQVPTLPFELVCIPKRWRQHVQLPYPRHSIPALMAVGMAKFYHDPPRNPFTRLWRRSVRAKSLAILESLQADDDSFLCSVPVSAFVVTCLSSIGYQDHRIVRRGIDYLLSSIRGDASWPVRTDHSLTNSVLAIDSLAGEHHPPGAKLIPFGRSEAGDHISGEHSQSAAGDTWQDTAQPQDTVTDHPVVGGDTQVAESEPAFSEQCLTWLLEHQESHANQLTETLPGGWAWSDAPGALPNAVSTAGALVALAHWRRNGHIDRDRIDRAARRGLGWLLDLQYDDGGWPTFYRDDGDFRFDQSAADVTAQVLRALAAWQHLGLSAAPALAERVPRVVERAWLYLASQQAEDGRFVSLWFGNEHQPEDQNPVYGTAQVLIACAELKRLDSELALRAATWLVSAQHSTGGWGPPRAPRDYSNADKDGFRAWRANEAMAKLCSVEESALAISALLPLVDSHPGASRAVSTGLAWLAAAVERDDHRRPAVIGYYLSRIWYHERLYPLVFATGAFSQAVRQLSSQPRETAPASTV